MIYINSCSSCENFISAKECLAFPNGIPADIWENKNDHKSEYPGDRGIQYERYSRLDGSSVSKAHKANSPSIDIETSSGTNDFSPTKLFNHPSSESGINID